MCHRLRGRVRRDTIRAMAKYGTQAWADELVAALNDQPDVRQMTDADITFQQVVTDAPDGEIHYWTTFASGAAQAGTGDADAADVTITQDYATATELSRGELRPQAAFMQGRLKITGNMGKLLQHQEALALLGPVMSTISTEY